MDAVVELRDVSKTYRIGGEDVRALDHVDLRIPRYNLEKATTAIEEAFPGLIHDEPLRFRDFMANTRRCRLYDFDEQVWLTYREAAARIDAAAA